MPFDYIFGQFLIALINGCFYAMLSLGLAIIFGILRILNFVHGAQYMMGAFTAWILARYLGVGYWGALLAAPVLVGLFGMVLERALIQRTYKLDHRYSLLLTFGLTLIIEGAFRQMFGSAGQPYSIPRALTGGYDAGNIYIPSYRLWVVVVSLTVCAAVWYGIEKTRYGAYLRAATEKPELVTAFGINVPLLVTTAYGLGVGLAALAGVLAAPIYQVSALMGAEILIVVFAVVVIGGMGSISGVIVTGILLGLLEGLTKVVFPEMANTVVFLLMAVVLLVRPQGLFGREA